MSKHKTWSIHNVVMLVDTWDERVSIHFKREFGRWSAVVASDSDKRPPAEVCEADLRGGPTMNLAERIAAHFKNSGGKDESGSLAIASRRKARGVSKRSRSGMPAS